MDEAHSVSTTELDHGSNPESHLGLNPQSTPESNPDSHPESDPTSTPVIVGKNHIGRGVYATRAIAVGEVLGPIVGKIITGSSYSSDYAMDLWEDRTLEPDPPFRFLNHSCSANCELFVWMEDDEEEPNCMWIEVIQSVEKGEELTLDYGWPAEGAIPCACGSLECRGWIVTPDELHLLEPIQGTAEEREESSPLR